MEGPQVLSFQLASEASFPPAAEHTFPKMMATQPVRSHAATYVGKKLPRFDSDMLHKSSMLLISYILKA